MRVRDRVALRVSRVLQMNEDRYPRYIKARGVITDIYREERHEMCMVTWDNPYRLSRGGWKVENLILESLAHTEAIS